MKRKALALTFIMALLFSVVAGTEFVNLGSANPYIHDIAEEREEPAPEGTEPLTILLTSPENYTTYASNNISLTFNTSWSESIDHFLYFELYYKASWQPKKTYLDYGSSARFVTINLKDVPEGFHQLEVGAVAKYWGYTTRQETKGLYRTMYFVSYRLNGSSTVNFTVSLPPKILILSLENETYNTSNVKLDFTIGEPISAMTYSLDGNMNVTVNGNTTLSGLPNGYHNVVVYATDETGNTGVSETISFSIDAPFSTVPAIAASGVSVVIVGVGLIMYLKKHKR
jgi:hypothetical protein